MNAAGTGPSRSHADFWWCKLAIQRKWSVEETEARLLEVSEKARERLRLGDPGYVHQTSLMPPRPSSVTGRAAALDRVAYRLYSSDN